MGTTAATMVADADRRVRALSPHQLDLQIVTGGCRVVDVREAEELDELGGIATAVHVPRGLLEFRADPTHPLHQPGLDPRVRVVLYCAGGSRSALAAGTLQQLGYTDVAHLAGGFDAWRAAGLPVVHAAGSTRGARP